MAVTTIEIDAPSGASEGDNVPVSVEITNVSQYHYSFKTEIYAGADLLLEAEDHIRSGTSRTYDTSFIMPPSDITILVWVERWAFDHWEYDNADSALVSLVAPPPQYEGTITRKDLEYDETWSSIPVAENVPQGQRGIVHVWGRNDMNTNQKMGIYWLVTDPEGYVVQEYEHWEAFWTGPGNEQGFLGGRFDLSKVGTYTIRLELLMNPDDPQVVDQYIGDLCNVAAVVPEYAGTISRKELEYDETRGSIPVW